MRDKGLIAIVTGGILAAGMGLAMPLAASAHDNDDDWRERREEVRERLHDRVHDRQDRWHDRIHDRFPNMSDRGHDRLHDILDARHRRAHSVLSDRFDDDDFSRGRRGWFDGRFNDRRPWFRDGRWFNGRDNRWYGRRLNSGFVPPGLAKKGGLPPGQAKKLGGPFRQGVGPWWNWF